MKKKIVLLGLMLQASSSMFAQTANSRSDINSMLSSWLIPAIARYDFEPPATLDNIEIAAILAKADELVSWVTDVKEYALRQALSGVSYDGFKVVEGRSNRKYTDENEVVEAVKSAGYDPYEHSVLGITAMTSLLGKKKFNELLGGLIEKPQGKPTLVSISDKRPAIHTANEDFKEEK